MTRLAFMLGEDPEMADVLTGLHRLAEHLDAATTQADLNDTTTPELVEHLYLLRGIATRLAKVDANMVRHLYLTADHHDTEYEGIGLVKIMRGVDRKGWDHHSLFHAVLEAHMAERGGEVPDPGEVLSWIMDAVGPAYWRVGVLRPLGIDPDEYATRTPGKPTVQFSRKENTP